jgi:thiamine phosphate synthase YjbQ (UPF0047 family)
MPAPPTEIRLTLEPRGRFDVIDVAARIQAELGEVLQRHRGALYCSPHTTAGYLEQRLASRLLHHRERLSLFFKAFGAVFPPEAAYEHDKMHLRAELSEAQRAVEPRNGDSHLTFIGTGMSNCVRYRNRAASPVYFIDLDGINQGTRRQRRTSVLGYDQETVVERFRLTVPTSRHPIDAINLGDARLGLFGSIDEGLARAGIEKGRVDIALEASESNVGLMVNEYETLLMQHDLREVLQNPLKFAAQKGRHMLDDPLAIPGKTINYARYDVVRVLNRLIEAFGVEESVVERLIARLMAAPARRFLRTRRISFLASDHAQEGRSRAVRGTYQNPILVQWQAPEGQSRELEISLVRLS